MKPKSQINPMLWGVSRRLRLVILLLALLWGLVWIVLPGRV